MDAQEWFSQVYRQYADFLFRVGRRFQNSGENEDILLDLIQEVFLVLWDRREELMQHPNVGGWLVEALKFRIRGSRSKMTRRALHHAYSLDEDDAAPIADGDITPEQYAATRQHIDAIRQLLGDENAELFLAYVLDGRSAHELALERGVSDSCIAMRVLRIKKRLAQHPEIFYALLLLSLDLRRFTA